MSARGKIYANPIHLAKSITYKKISLVVVSNLFASISIFLPLRKQLLLITNQSVHKGRFF